MGKSPEGKLESDFDGWMTKLTELCDRARVGTLRYSMYDRDVQRYTPIVFPAPTPTVTVLKGVDIVPIKQPTKHRILWTYRVHSSETLLKPYIWERSNFCWLRPAAVIPFAFHDLVQRLFQEPDWCAVVPLQDAVAYAHKGGHAGEPFDDYRLLPNLPPDRASVATGLRYLQRLRACYLDQVEQAFEAPLQRRAR